MTYPISALDKLYKACQSIDDKIDLINPLICNSGRAKPLADNHEYYSLEDNMGRLGIKVAKETYDEVKEWIEDKYKAILKFQYDKLDHSSIPRYVKTGWGAGGTMYGEAIGFTYTHWTVPLFSRGELELSVKFKTTRPCGRREHNGWVCPGGDDRHKFGELHEMLTEITKEEYDSQPEILITQEQWDNRDKGAAWNKNAAAHGFVKA